MIRIHRGPEPDALRQTREWRLARALLRYGTTRERPPTDDGYDSARPSLKTAQHAKCAYCEAAGLRRSAPLDHHRPRATYWWLTWSWDNLFLTCGTCNTIKNDHYPLLDHSIPLAIGEPPPGHERPALVDPALEDPRLHIRFAPRPDPENPGERRWEPHPLTDRGDHTIRALGLHDDLLDNYRDHAEGLLHPEGPLAGLRADAIAGKDIIDPWRRLVLGALQPKQPYRSLTHDILTAFRDALRADHGIELPPIPTIADHRPPPPPAPLFAPDPTLDDWPHPIHLHIRLARNNQTTDTECRRAVFAVLTHRPQTREQLAALFHKTPETIRLWIQLDIAQRRVLVEGRGPTALYRTPHTPPATP